MSDQIDAAVEKILNDPEFATEVLKNPERTLTRAFDLEWGEWRSIHWALLQDVAGHVNLAEVDMDFVKRVPEYKGTFDTHAMGPTIIPSGRAE